MQRVVDNEGPRVGVDRGGDDDEYPQYCQTKDTGCGGSPPHQARRRQHQVGDNGREQEQQVLSNPDNDEVHDFSMAHRLRGTDRALQEKLKALGGVRANQTSDIGHRRVEDGVLASPDTVHSLGSLMRAHDWGHVARPNRNPKHSVCSERSRRGGLNPEPTAYKTHSPRDHGCYFLTRRCTRSGNRSR